MLRALLSAALLSAACATVNVPLQQIAPGVSIPVISIGTWTEGTTSNSSLIVDNWLAQGGRGIDSAYIYFDQKKVAAAIAASGIPREQLYITSKIPTCGVLPDTFVEADLKELGTSYIDLMLIHSAGIGCESTWKKLEAFVASGKLKAIGVSNWKTKDFEKVLPTATIKPAVNQISHSVLEHDDETVAYCAQNNITVEAYSPLGSPGRSKSNNTVFTDPTISSIAKAHNVSNPQVALRWIVQQGHILTVLSENAAHQANDADVFGFELTDAEMTQLSQIQSASTRGQ